MQERKSFGILLNNKYSRGKLSQVVYEEPLYHQLTPRDPVSYHLCVTLYLFGTEIVLVSIAGKTLQSIN